jgi:hypothetical protein
VREEGNNQDLLESLSTVDEGFETNFGQFGSSNKDSTIYIATIRI